MEYALLKHVVTEISEKLLPAKISKIYQPDANNIVIKLWNGRANYRLLLAVEPEQSRIHLTNREFVNPSRPPRFCQLLRARINHIERISLKEDDRIVTLKCKNDRGVIYLIAELTGKHPNLILTDDSLSIIDSLNRVTGNGAKREVRAGVLYCSPESSFKVGSLENIADVLIEGDFPYNDYAEKIADNKSEQRQDLHQLLIKLVKRYKKKVAKRVSRIEADLAAQEKAENYKVKGELLLANFHQLRRGMASVVLLNYYNDPPDEISVSLDPVLDGPENAERYFKIYKKYKRGVDHHVRRLDESETELKWLEELEYQLQDNIQRSDLENIAEELRGCGLLKDAGGLNAKRTTVKSGPREAFSPSGLKVIWGRDNRQNDEITTRYGKTGDFWFHAHKIPGSHVVLKTAGSVPREEDLLFAARIAAGYSKANTDVSVEVIETDIKNVDKKKGAPPGQVFVRAYNVRLVAPLRID